jgi:hypothetical protein
MLNDHRLGFGLPCACLSELRCTVYPERPSACAHYRCRLLHAMRAGEIAKTEALDLVRRARALLEKIEAYLPPENGRTLWQRVSDRWDLSALKPLLASGDLNVETLNAIVSLDLLLSRFFQFPSSKPGSGSPKYELPSQHDQV